MLHMLQARILPPSPGPTCSSSVNPKKDTDGEEKDGGGLTSCVGTRWYRAPELLYGSTQYGPEVDLWSLGCIFAELILLEPFFPGTSDIDQLSRIFTLLGDMDTASCPGCTALPGYNTISFRKVSRPVGIESRLPGRDPEEVRMLRSLLCLDPSRRASPIDLVHGNYLSRDDPFPVPAIHLRVPVRCTIDLDSLDGWMDSGSDLEGGFHYGGTNEEFF